MAATQLDEERSEFDTFKSSTRTDINAQLEALEEERVRVTDETAKFETYRNEALNQLRAEQKAFETERTDFDSQRSSMLSSLQSKRDALDTEVTQHMKVRTHDSHKHSRASLYLHTSDQYCLRRQHPRSRYCQEHAKAEALLEDEKHRVTVMQQDLEKLEQELTNQKWRLVKERKHYEEERKHLSRLLLGMGEKMSNNGFASVEDEMTMLEQEMIEAHKDNSHKREVAVYQNAYAEENLLGIVPLYSSTTVGDIRVYIADKFLSSPTFSMKKKDSSIRITSDSYAAVDFFKPGDYIVAVAGAVTDSNPGSPAVSVMSSRQ